MKIEKLEQLEKQIHQICDNHQFNEIEAEKFNVIIEQTINDISSICEWSEKELKEAIGDY